MNINDGGSEFLMKDVEEYYNSDNEGKWTKIRDVKTPPKMMIFFLPKISLKYGAHPADSLDVRCIHFIMMIGSR